MDNQEPQLAREIFTFRFSAKKPKDVQLAEWIAADIAAGTVNISQVIKDLLYEWYLQRHQTGTMAFYLPAGPEIDPALFVDDYGRENPDDLLVQKLVNVNFDGV
jgi:hypothetical protein